MSAPDALFTNTPIIPLVVGQTFQFFATTRYGVTLVDATTSVTWSSDDPSVQISPTGLATATSLGTAGIRAELLGVPSPVAIVEVEQIAAIAVTSPIGFTSVGLTEQFSATATLSPSGTLADVTNVVDWNSSDELTATVGANTGSATGLSAGVAMIAATDPNSGVFGDAKLTVESIAGIVVAPTNIALIPGLTQQFSATATLAPSGAIVDATQGVDWTSSQPGIVAIDQATGLATGLGETLGITITAQDPVSLTSGTAIVDAETLQAIAVVVNGGGAAGVLTGGTLQLDAIGAWSLSGPVLMGSQATWSASDPSIASADATGLVTGVAPREVTITASGPVGSGVSGSLLVTVDDAAFVGWAAMPADQSIIIGATLQYELLELYSDGSVQPSANPVTGWSTGNAGIATIDSAGLLTAAGTGTINVQVDFVDDNSQAASVSTTITVTPTDVTPPTVPPTPGVFPADGATEVALGVTLSATFSEPLDPNSVNDATFTLADATGPIAGTVIYNPGTLQATFKPTAPLAENTIYTAVITTGITDLAGNALAAPVTWTFTTVVDGTAPTIVSTSPAADETNVAVADLVTVTFSEAINPATLNASTFAVRTGGTDIPGSIAYDPGTFTATFTPSPELVGNTIYEAAVTSGVTDAAPTPNTLATPLSWLFATVPVPIALTIDGDASVLEGSSTAPFYVSTVAYSDGSTAPIPIVTWSVVDGTGTASVNASTGVVTGGTPGIVTVRATHVGTGVTATRSLVVVPKIVIALAVGGDATVVEGLSTAPFTVTSVSYDNGDTTPIPSVTWSIVDGTGTATVIAATGVVTGGTPGTVTAVATHASTGVTASADLIVLAKTVTAFTIGGDAAVVEGLSTAPFAVTSVTYDNGDTSPLPTVTWNATSGTGTATVNASTGVVTGGTPGTVTVAASETQSGVTANTGLIVLAKTLTSLTITGDANVFLGASTNPFTVASVTYDNGDTAPIPTVTWSVVLVTGFATIDAVTGVATGTSEGTVTVHATHPGSGVASNALTLAVLDKLVTSLTISGPSSVVEGQTTSSIAVSAVTYDNGDSSPVPTVVWNVLGGTGSASINAISGVLTGLTPGTVQVTATEPVSGVTSNAITLTVVAKTLLSLTVGGPATVVQGIATLYSVTAATYDNGDTSPPPAVIWSVTGGTGAASVNPTTGVLTGGTPGTVTLTATHAATGVNDSIVVTVVAKTVTSITIGGATVVVEGLTTPAYTVTGVTYDNGDTSPIPTVIWSVINGTGTASINASGVATGGLPGTVTVRATEPGSGQIDDLTLTVVAKTVTGITVVGDATVVEGMGTTAYAVTAVTYDNGDTAPLPTGLVWSVTAGSGTAAVNASSGVVTGANLGTVFVRAQEPSSGVYSIALTLTVVAKTLTGMTVAGDTTVVEGLSTAAYTITAALYNNGDSAPLPTGIQWSVTNETGTATIGASSGIATGGSPGTVTITATHPASGVTDDFALNVVGKTVTSLTVGGDATVYEGNTTAAHTVTAVTYNNGDTSPIPTVTWSITNGTGTASVNATTGAVTGGTPGTATLIGTHVASGVSDSMAITVLAKVVTSLTISGDAIVVQGLTTSAFTVTTVTYSNGDSAPIPSVTWSVTNGTGTATIGSSSGVATGVTAGTVTVRATAVGGAYAEQTLTVLPIVVTSLTISGAATVVQGVSTAAYSVSAVTYNDGSTSPIPSVTWSVINGTGTATINPSTGVATGVSAGTVTVRATEAGGVYGEQTLTVVPVAVTSITISGAATVVAGLNTTAYSVTAVTYNDGSTSPIPSVTWSVTNVTGTATINPTTGVATGVSAGTVTVRATESGGVFDEQTLTVLPIVVTSLTISGAATVVEGVTTSAYTVTAVTYNDGSTAPIPTVTWSVTNGTGTASVNSSTGVVTGGTPGTVTVIGTHVATGVSDSLTLTVQTKTLTALTISGAATVVEGLSTAAYTVTAATYNNGDTAPIPTVTWSVTNGPGTASVNSSTGVVTGGTIGTVTVIGTHVATGVNDSLTLTVQAKTLTSLTVSGDTTVVQGLDTAAYTVTAATYNNGDTAPLPTVTWSVSSGTGTASINSSTGVATGGSPGSVTLTATHVATGVSDDFALNVLNKTVTMLTISGAATVYETKNTAAYTVSGVLYDNGDTAPIPTVTWSVVNGTGSATVNASSGVVTGVTPGDVTVRATHVATGTVSNGITLTVLDKLVTGLTITGDSAVLEGNSTAAYTVSAVSYNNGDSAPIPTVVWSVTPGTGSATINSSTGVVTAVTAGDVTVNATDTESATVSNSITLTISARTVVSFTISGDSNVYEGSATAACTLASVLYSDASTSPLPSVTWNVTSGTGSATINATTGVVTGVAAGTVTVDATHVASGVTASIPVTLTVDPKVLVSVAIDQGSISTPLGLDPAMTATGTYNDASTANVTFVVAWASTSTGVATIGLNSGLVTTKAMGSTSITATAVGAGAGGVDVVSPAITLTVDPAELASIVVSPSPVINALPLSQNQQFAATGTNTDGTSAGDITASLNWNSTDTGVATIGLNSGLASPVAPGTTVITATDPVTGVVSPNVNLTVVSDYMLSVAVTPDPPANLPRGNTQQFTAVGTLTDLSSTGDISNAVSWPSSNPSVATISSTGLVTAIATGSTNITANAVGSGSGGVDVVSPAVSLTVVAPVLTSLTVSAAGGVTTVPQSASVQLSAIGTLSDGSTSNETTNVTWVYSGSDIGIDANGLLTGLVVNPTPTAIAATLGAVDSDDSGGSISMQVVGGSLQSIEVTPSAGSVFVGSTLQFQAIGHFADGSSANVTPAMTWASTATGVATVDASGLATSVSAGSATITATDPVSGVSSTFPGGTSGAMTVTASAASQGSAGSPLPITTPYTGQVQGGSTNSYYVIGGLIPGQLYRVTQTTLDADVYMELWDDNTFAGTRLCYSENFLNSSAPENCVGAADGSGQIYVRMIGQKPNDTASTATYGISVTGPILSPYWVETWQNSYSAGGGRADTIIEVYHSSDTANAIGYNDDGGSEVGLFMSGLVVNMDSGETYYIKVTNYQSNDGGYSLKVNNVGFVAGDASPDPATGANEPNDTPGQATVVTLNTQSDNALKVGSDLEDWFVITIP